MANDSSLSAPKQIVAQGYDRIAERYAGWARGIRRGQRRAYRRLLLEQLPEGAAVLELGCGNGLPVARELATRFRVTGVDLSARQIELARANVPEATFIHADMATLDFPPQSIDAVAAFYSIIHLPRDEQPRLFRSIATWLCRGGLFVATLGAGATEAGYDDDWLGAHMFWSHFDSETNQRLIREAGLEILTAQEETADENGAPATFLGLVARRPA